jgi:DNA-directed RNA polymerase specialized sigma24 family protein
MQGNESGNDQSVVQWRAHVARAYECHASRIASALSRAYGAARADDAVQEMFLRALSWRRDDVTRERVMDFSYMTKCTSRVALRHIRTETRRAHCERGRSASSARGCPWEITPARLAERKERCDLAAQALGELPSWQRPAVQMMVVDRRRCSDVARITGIRATTLNNWRHRFAVDARQRLDPRD